MTPEQAAISRLVDRIVEAADEYGEAKAVHNQLAAAGPTAGNLAEAVTRERVTGTRMRAYRDALAIFLGEEVPF